MRTLEQAIEQRLEELRQVQRRREEQERQAREAQEQREAEAAAAFRQWLSQLVEADVSGLEILVREYQPNRTYPFDPKIMVDGGYIKAMSSYRLEGDGILWEAENRRDFWRAVRGNLYTDRSLGDFLDALIYAMGL